ncbi:MAG: hypothetical protein EZS28_044468, partial [Streblomastix strix]
DDVDEDDVDEEKENDEEYNDVDDKEDIQSVFKLLSNDNEDQDIIQLDEDETGSKERYYPEDEIENTEGKLEKQLDVELDNDLAVSLELISNSDDPLRF